MVHIPLKFSAKRMLLFRRKISAIALSVVLGLSPCLLMKAEAAYYELTDAQLDAVYAEGIFFNFDVAFGTLNDVMTLQSSGGRAQLKDDIKQTANNNIKEVKSGTSAAPDTGTADAPSSTTSASGSSGVSDPAPLSGASTPLDSSNQASADTALPQDAGPTSDGGATAPLQFNVVGSSTPDGGVQFGLVDPTQSSSGSGTGSLNDTLGQLPGGTEIPEIPETPAVPVPDANPVPNVTPVNGSGNNIVNVSGSSQKYLSSLVNVNSAGSIVTVLLNIVVNINSNIQNLSSNNNVDLSNYYKF